MMRRAIQSLYRLLVSAVVLGALTCPSAAAERGLLAVSNRFLDGTVDPRSAKVAPVTTVIDSFEDAEAVRRDWAFFRGAAGEPVGQHVTEGKTALKLTFAGKVGYAAYRRGAPGWGNPETDRLAAWSGKVLFSDEARLDVFNAEDRAVTLLVTMGKTFRFNLKPGRNEVAMPTREMLPAVYRATAILPGTRIAVDDDRPVTLYLDHFRWVGPGLGENLLKHGKCFDAGPVDDPWTRPGFLRLSSKVG